MAIVVFETKPLGKVSTDADRFRYLTLPRDFYPSFGHGYATYPFRYTKPLSVGRRTMSGAKAALKAIAESVKEQKFDVAAKQARELLETQPDNYQA